jgi:hypothetical protein
MSQSGQREDVHQHSGWLIPLGFFLAILALSSLLLGWYLRPSLRPAPTARSTLVQARVRGVAFAIPANYLAGAAARAGGDQDAIALQALFPSFRGYSEQEARLFAGNAPDSPVIHMALRGDPNNLDARARLARIYMPYIRNPAGEASAFDLTRYDFTSNSGYERDDLFAGETERGLVLLLCERASAELPSPNCIAIDRHLAGSLSFSYRFKRAWLARWREISGGVNGLLARFEQKPRG